ncbi:MAG: hypothetical protein NTU44_10395, partial [Bacteroidetes bacterium]|nr:hypothetical protein [Bacteroidota bacterium]
ACPNNYLALCPGCDASVELQDMAGNTYNYAGFDVTWEYLEAPFDCSNGPPSGFPLFPTNSQVPLTIQNDPNWKPTKQFTNTLLHTNPLYTTTWYRVTVDCGSMASSPKSCYAVVVVVDPPVKPVIVPAGPEVVCIKPFSYTINAQDPAFTAVCSPSGSSCCIYGEYLWSPGGSWTPWTSTSPILPFTVTDWGSYTLSVRNSCGSATSDPYNVEQEPINTYIDAPCCVCEGCDATLTAMNLPPGYSLNWWSTDMAINTWLWSSGNYNKPSFTVPITQTTTFTLIVYSQNLCFKVLTHTIIVCPK